MVVRLLSNSWYSSRSHVFVTIVGVLKLVAMKREGKVVVVCLFVCSFVCLFVCLFVCSSVQATHWGGAERCPSLIIVCLL